MNNKRRERDLTGNRYGKLTVIKPLGQCKENDLHYFSLVRCDCGNEFKVRDSMLVNGRANQCMMCGRSSVRKHGLTKTPLFNVWQNMRGRCYNPSDKSYELYGGRGIRICAEWKNDFKAFYDWALKNGYRKGVSIDRIDVNGNYEPSNCRWTDVITQARNKRNTMYAEYEGKRLPVQEISEITGIKAGTIGFRLRNGWSDYDATHIKAGQKERQTPRVWKKRAYITFNGNTNIFDSCSEASRFLGFNKGYLLNRRKKLKTNEFKVGDYHVKIEEHCYKL